LAIDVDNLQSIGQKLQIHLQTINFVEIEKISPYNEFKSNGKGGEEEHRKGTLA